MLQVVLGGGWILVTEQTIVEADLGVERVRGRHPMQRRLHLAFIGRIAAPRGRVVGRADFDDGARRGIFHDAGARDEVRASQADLLAWRQPEELLRRDPP